MLCLIFDVCFLCEGRKNNKSIRKHPTSNGVLNKSIDKLNTCIWIGNLELNSMPQNKQVISTQTCEILKEIS